jgi:hypothetical protein
MNFEYIDNNFLIKYFLQQHFPKQIGRFVLGIKQKTILVQAETQYSFSCKLITAKRNKAEKYISKEWCQFVRRTRLQVGDKVLFKLQNPPTKLLIQTTRSKART